MGLNIDDVSVVYPAADGRPPVEALSQIACRSSETTSSWPSEHPAAGSPHS
jgi:hypothetical protein